MVIIKQDRKKWLISLLMLAITSPLLSYAEKNTSTNQDKSTINKSKKMKKILIIGIDPATIDFSNPDLVPGLTVEKIEAGMKTEQEKLSGLGYQATFFLFPLKETNVSKLAAHLKTGKYEGIVIGAGIRVPQNTFALFEKIINTVHENAPDSRIMFNTLPTNTTEAVQRWLK